MRFFCFFRFHWLKGSNRQSNATVEWFIPPSAPTGSYRIRHFGHYKQLIGLRPVITPYEGSSDVFKVTDSFYHQWHQRRTVHICETETDRSAAETEDLNNEAQLKTRSGVVPETNKYSDIYFSLCFFAITFLFKGWCRHLLSLYFVFMYVFPLILSNVWI